MTNLAEVSVRDFRAIKSAEIRLDGITVVSGINGCGKSTLSKLLYYVFRNANSYEELILDYTNGRLRPYVNVLDQIRSSLYILGDSNALNHKLTLYRRFDLLSLDEAGTFIERAKELCGRLLELEMNLPAVKGPVISDRFLSILRSTLKIRDDRSLKTMLDELLQHIKECFTEAETLLAERPYSFLKSSLNSVFDCDLSKKIVVKEFGETIFGEGLANVPLPHYFQKVAYVDTPMAIGLNSRPGLPSYWEDLNDLLKNPPKKGYKWSISNIIKKEIINGDVSYDDDLYSGGFRYKRTDGEEFDLTDCATGIKAFAMLQLLLKNQFLDENSMMIIDEPEAHLHPQWIVEYARILVLLHKRIGVKFFIASHSTDMVSALRYIAEKEKCLSKLLFYAAENAGPDTYVFKNLGHDIEPIFESFNKSFESLDKYAGGKEV